MVSPPQQPPANPNLLLLDADALLQIFISGQILLLRFLKRAFQIQPAITEAVEAEIRRSKKFRTRFTHDLQKALDSETLVVLDARTLPVVRKNLIRS